MLMKKTFDCVEMKHRGAEQVQTAIAGMSREQEIQFWRERFAEAVEAQTVAKEKYGSLSMVDILRELSPSACNQPAKAIEAGYRR